MTMPTQGSKLPQTKWSSRHNINKHNISFFRTLIVEDQINELSSSYRCHIGSAELYRGIYSTTNVNRKVQGNENHKNYLGSYLLYMSSIKSSVEMVDLPFIIIQQCLQFFSPKPLIFQLISKLIYRPLIKSYIIVYKNYHYGSHSSALCTLDLKFVPAVAQIKTHKISLYNDSSTI